VRSAYDGSAYGAAPTKGDETATAKLAKGQGSVSITSAQVAKQRISESMSARRVHLLPLR
jgi:hypothetical protein